MVAFTCNNKKYMAADGHLFLNFKVEGKESFSTLVFGFSQSTLLFFKHKHHYQLPYCVAGVWGPCILYEGSWQNGNARCQHAHFNGPLKEGVLMFPNECLSTHSSEELNLHSCILLCSKWYIHTEVGLLLLWLGRKSFWVSPSSSWDLRCRPWWLTSRTSTPNRCLACDDC